MEMLSCEIIPMPEHSHKCIRNLLLCPSESNLREDKNVTRRHANIKRKMFYRKVFLVGSISSVLIGVEFSSSFALLPVLS
ncbi:hypothetical protein llap_3358 [Limosa lapponica baueri]|uniref:Uncharacterized protein n=1 Tax=Limosa lapponica baueri TaxID=1758121 RepID=A0A2I0UJV2_LIMLA|nr:hypothetical protein llap_3358 [Limosa lapponica baueri]